MSQILQGLAYMHSRLICHRDIKLENIIYQESTETVKIIDFGFANSCKEKLKVFCGTPSYMAPEIVAKKEYSGSAADVWSAGVVMYAMLTGGLPFKGTDEKGLYRKIQAGSYPVPTNL